MRVELKMDKLKTRILLISLLLLLLFSVQSVAAATDDNGNLTSDSIDLSICDNEGDVSSDKLSNNPDNILTASKTVGATDDVRAMFEQDITVGGNTYHLFAGDKFPVGAVVASGDGYEVDPTIIAKVMTVLPPYMSAFEVGTSFFNARSLTENHYLTFGHNSLEHLYAHPFIRVMEI